MEPTIPNRADAPAALAVAIFFLSFGIFGIVRPDKLRTAMDNFANTWREGSWHPYQMSLPILRLTVGGVGITGAALFFYIAYLALAR